MGNFGGDRRSSFGGRGSSRGGFQSRGRSSFGGGRGFDRGNDRGPREMFQAVCDNCGKDCEVPFRPTSGKPVYCSDCFEKMGGRDSNSRGDRNDRPRPEFRAPAPVQDFSELNAKLDRIIKLLEPKLESKVEIVKELKAPKVKKAKKVVEVSSEK